MIKNKKQVFIIIGAFILTLLFGSTTYAFFNYTRTGATNTLLVGQIYMNHTEGTEITLTNIFPETREEARARNDNTLTIQITGLNESDRDVYYKLMLVTGSQVESRDRIRDELLRFDLVEILPNNEEKYIVYNENFTTINNTVLTRNRIDAGTTSNVTRTYRLRMWIDEGLTISDTDQDADYTTEEFNNLFASVKIKAQGNIEDVYYYNSFSNALSAINEESYESETTRSTAKAGIYIDSDDNTTNLVLYDDVEINERYNITKPVHINLYHNRIEYKVPEVGEVTALIFKKEFSIENGTIHGEYTDSTDINYYLFLDAETGVINNIVFEDDLRDNTYSVKAYRSDLLIKNSSFENTTIGTTTNANINFINSRLDGVIYFYNNATLQMDDSYATWTDLDMVRREIILVTVDTGCTLIVNNSTIFADSPGEYIDHNTENYVNGSIGIGVKGTLIFNSGYVFGTHSAIQTSPGGKIYVYGGTFESTDHGGFYFAHGPSGVAYIENANIRGVSYPSNGIFRPNGIVNSIQYNNTTYTLEEVKSAFYMGGNSSHNNQNVYLVNCNIIAESQYVFVMRYSTPYQKLYMSGCTVYSSQSDPIIRIDNFSNMKLYSGINNSFGNSRIRNSSSVFVTVAEAKQQGTIVDTNVDYKDIVRPQ